MTSGFSQHTAGAERVPRKLRAIDRLTLLFLAGLAAVTALCHPRPCGLLGCMAALTAVTVALAVAHDTSRMTTFMHDFLPIANLIAIFTIAGPIIPAVNPVRWDETLARLDRALFGTLPERWFGVLGRPWWLTDAASLAYVSYYLLPVVLAGVLWVAHRAAFERFTFAVVAMFLASYVGYFLMPTSGPRVPPDLADVVVGGGRFSHAVRAFIQHAEGNQLDAFPSGHTAVTLVVLGAAWPVMPRWRLPVAAVVAAIVFSTVYLGFHYVIDVVAGVALAAAMPLVLPSLRRATLLEPPRIQR